MRTCGTCSWLDHTITNEYRQCRCDAAPQHVYRACDRKACALWKPKQDWRNETCGTCEFFEDDDEGARCRRAPGVPARGPQRACAEWMPHEDEDIPCTDAE